MDCLRSFIVSIDQVTTFSGTDVKTWFVGAQEFWVVEKAGVSTFVPEGFKNIDIYGVDTPGDLKKVNKYMKKDRLLPLYLNKG
jgi:hypothetical protein